MSDPHASGADAMVSGETIVAAVRIGMDAIMALKAQPVDVERKDDDSPVTAADRAAECAITDYLRKHTSIPVVAEELFSRGEAPDVEGVFLLVDPLDGTKSYIAGSDDYTVNVALIENGDPVFGCVGVPETGVLYRGGRDESASMQTADGVTPLSCRPPTEELDVVASKNHLTPETEAYLAQIRVAEMKSVGSSLKFCLLAKGEADLYPRFGRTMQWDTAAGDAVLRAAGGLTIEADGRPLRYGRSFAPDEDIYANPHFIALADPALVKRPGIVPGR